MKKVLSEFKVFLDLMMQIQNQKTKDALVLKTRMEGNLKAIILLIESEINERLLFPKNKLVSANEEVIVRTINSVKLFNNDKKTGKGLLRKDEKKLMSLMSSLLNKRDSKMTSEDMQAIKVFLPTLLIQSVGKLVRTAEKNEADDMNKIMAKDKQKFNDIQKMLKKWEKKKQSVNSLKKNLNRTRNSKERKRKTKNSSKKEEIAKENVIESKETAQLFENPK